MKSSKMRVGNNQDHEKEFCPDHYFEKFAEKGILENIFSRITCRRPLALVNKLFYKTVCKLDNEMDIFRARFEQDYLVWEDGYIVDNLYSSIFHSQRVVTEIFIHKMYLVDIIGDTFETNFLQSEYLMQQTLNRISFNLKKLTISACMMTERQLMTMLDAIQKDKLKELNIIKGAIIHEKGNKINRKLRFPALEKLDMTMTKYGSPNSKDPISDDNEMFWFLRSIDQYSPYLKDLSIHQSFIYQLNMGNMKLERLCVEQGTPANIRLAAIVSFHSNYLTEIDFLNCYVMEDVLNEILHAKNMKSLKINMEGISLRGLINIANTSNIIELGLKCTNACKWIVSALAMHTLVYVRKLYLDIKELDVNYAELSRILNKNISNIHVVASQPYILRSLFSSTFIDGLETCTVELHVDGIKYKQLLVIDCVRLKKLSEFTLINRNKNFHDYECDLQKILCQAQFLEKLRIEGFKVTDKLVEIAMAGHHHLEELYLINPKNIDCNFVFDKSACHPISLYGRRLKVLEISCVKSKLKRSTQFPFIARRGNLKIFRHR